MMPIQPSPVRFLTPRDVAEELNTSQAQVMALLRSGELPAIKIGGRGFWRIERSALEDYIVRCYERTRRFIQEHPAADGDNEQTD